MSATVIIPRMADQSGGTPPILFEGVARDFEGRVAVADLDLRVASGELFGLIGPNGAGKTTTIKMAVGLLRPSRGRVLICGHDIQRQGSEARRHLGYVPDNAALYEKLTGLEMLELASDLHGVSRERRRRRIPALLGALELSSASGQLVQSYSRGMRQKLALCAALMPDPEVVFLDEPTVGLDPHAARQLKTMLRTLCDTGHTVFLSTHALEIASALCDRVGIFRAGRLVALGSVAELERRGGADSGGPGALEDAFMAVTGAADEETTSLIRALSA
ncbi:MAG TPA: ABC transporter ATP-binding protein [Candidatus Nanopelagicaceae bacterium]|nr:ABC transporter ATP-binding protein [Candidatus Nanopelagicaceae bacterium]